MPVIITLALQMGILHGSTKGASEWNMSKDFETFGKPVHYLKDMVIFIFYRQPK